MSPRKRPPLPQPKQPRPLRAKSSLSQFDQVNFTSKPLPVAVKARTWKTYLWYSIVGVLGAILLASLGIFIYILLILKELPSPEELANYSITSTTKILARDGTLLYEAGDDGARRTVVTLDQINSHMIDATLAAEDDSFFSHPGFDWTGIARALYRDAMNKISGSSSVQGGSTITQQFVKLAFLSPEKTLKRKLSELILSVELEQHFTKEQILAMYLNKVFYGYQSYGVQAASKTYFKKDAKDLTIAESASLAAIAQLPSYYSPYNNFEGVMKRKQFILNRMRTLNMLNDAEFNKASNDQITFAPYKDNIKAPHFVFYIMQELAQTYGNELQGLNIYTTLDPALQEHAEKVVKEGALKNEKNYGASNAALVSLDPKTGEILAMVGSRDYFDDTIDGKVNVTLSKRQPGSTFKPFTYAALFSKGFGTGTVLFDVKTDFGSGYTPANYDGKYRGPVTVRSALANSLNIPAVAAQYLANVEDTLSLVHDMGVEYLDREDGANTGLSLALGVEEITPLDMARGYSVFANNGQRIDTGGILKITTDQGKVLWERAINLAGEKVLDPQAAYLVSNILSDNNARPANWSNLFIPNYTVAVKTGTSINIVNNVKRPKDLWTVGYTPSLVTAVWTGNNKGEIPVLTADGISTAASIWKAYMIKALANKPNEPFVRPEQIKEVAISTQSGLLPSSTTPSDKVRTELFPDYGVPTKVEQSFASARVDQISGKLATEECSANVAQYVYQSYHSILYYLRPEDGALQRWEDGIQAWAESNKTNPETSPTTATTDNGIPIVYVDSLDKIPTEPCQVLSAEESGLTMSTPWEGSKVTVGQNRATFNIRSPQDIAKVAVYIDGVEASTQTNAPFDQILYTIPESPTGSIHTVRFAFTLHDSRQVVFQSGVVVGNDATPPSITLLEPSERSVFHPGQSFQISVDVTDEQGIEKVELFFDSTPILTLQNKPYTTSFTIPVDMPSGAHELSIRAYDTESNVSRLTHTITTDSQPQTSNSFSNSTDLEVRF